MQWESELSKRDESALQHSVKLWFNCDHRGRLCPGGMKTDQCIQILICM